MRTACCTPSSSTTSHNCSRCGSRWASVGAPPSAPSSTPPTGCAAGGLCRISQGCTSLALQPRRSSEDLTAARSHRRKPPPRPTPAKQTVPSKPRNRARAWQWGVTGLLLAAANGHGECALLLLRNGANPEARDCKGLTPEDWARRCGHTAILKALREHRDKERRESRR
mmetsp:Transcript_56899/g.156336  ORF Transcript_56899/g.156336 Transcript_56899/m.156336 type:complete len:169 (-) Transcript_56899:148-654(-)